MLYVQQRKDGSSIIGDRHVPDVIHQHLVQPIPKATQIVSNLPNTMTEDNDVPDGTERRLEDV